ncbi:MAG TPA: hypothetical protein VL086_19540 [Candidatus Nitrosotalea sp.]|nr:hypothetical protein [Candidatus Nitrosotalea sp.]
MLKAFLRHVALPAVAPAAVVGLYFTPVLLFGCVNRGLLALAVVLLSAGAAFVTVGIGLREQARGRSSAKWLISTLILTTPLVLVLGPLG